MHCIKSVGKAIIIDQTFILVMFDADNYADLCDNTWLLRVHIENE